MPGPRVTDAPPPGDRVERVAAAQGRRDRARLVAAQEEIVALRHRVEELERSPSRLALAPARKAVHAVRRLMRPAALTMAPPSVCPPASRGLALVIDNQWPEPDRDSGSVDIVTLAACLRRLGFDVILAAAMQHGGHQPARDRLVAQGIRCLQPTEAESVAQFILRHGASLDLCVLCRVFCGGEFLELVQRHCGRARLVFDSIDLNYLREERKAQVTQDATLAAALPRVREREEHVIRSCDATMVVSEAELALLADTLPDCLVVQMPLARPVQAPSAAFAERRGIGFVGSFAHAPNADAVRYFLAEIWPLVQRSLPGCEFSIVGADAPSDLLDGAAGPVRLLGHVPDVAPWFESLRLTVAPLRFGAGAKGKVASSLAAGVPCIVTPVASEGMALAGTSGVIVAGAPADFAAAVVRAYGDAALWAELSAGALAYADRMLSPAAWQDRLDAMLQRIGF